MYREDIIIPLVTNKNVLDCGGVDHNFRELRESRGDWLHGIIAEHAYSCLGVDILEEAIKGFKREDDYKFIVANVETLPFREDFDVVVAGEIVEHIYNMGLFLDSAWRVLKDSGILIMTTPNAFGISHILKAVVLGKEVMHPEHTCYYSTQTLSYVVSRHGFKVQQLHILPRPALLKIVQLFRHFVSGFRPILGETIVLVAQKLPMQEKYSDKW